MSLFRVPPVLVALSALVLAGCSSFGISKPTPGQKFDPGPVVVQVDWTPSGQLAGLEIYVNDVAVNPAAITMGPDGATTTLAGLPPGAHRVAAAGLIPTVGRVRSWTRTNDVQFTILPPDFTMTLEPEDVTGRRGQASSLTVNVTRSGGLVGPISLQATGPALGQSDVSGQVAAGANTATMTLPVPATAPFGGSRVTVRAEAPGVGGAIVRTGRVDLNVLRQTGSFSQAGFAVTTPPQTASSPGGGAFVVEAVTGSSVGSPAPYAAVFKTAAGQRVGFPINYFHGDPVLTISAFGGAGFCSGGTAGFVLSGTSSGPFAQPGVTPAAGIEYIATFRDLNNPSRQVEVQVDEWRQAQRSDPVVSFVPAVYFSPDCSLALAVGVDTTGSAKHVAQLVDVSRAALIGNFWFDTPTFSARVEANAATERVVFTAADGRTSSLPIQ